MVRDGIDVSQHQGVIDWDVAKRYIDFAIIRAGYGQDIPAQDDSMFKRNADECTRLGIPFGVYLYSYAQNESDALSEARHVMRLIKDYKMAYPIYLDLEDARVGRLSNSQIEKNARVFADELQRHQYLPGFYANYFWWRTKLTGPLFSRYTRWVARYADELGDDINLFDMWQYSDKGFVGGIEGPVDLNYSFKDFPFEIMSAGLNNFNKEELPKKQYKIGDRIRFDRVFISSESTTPLIPYSNEGTITRVLEGARNPYLIGDGLGWVNDDVIMGLLRQKEDHESEESLLVMEDEIDLEYRNEATNTKILHLLKNGMMKQ